jgi:hypothetical protein
MYTHGPSCLNGPVSRRRPWWAGERKQPNSQSPPADGEKEDPTPAEPPFRADLVERIRREIAAGNYETPEKWEEALRNLWRRLADD